VFVAAGMPAAALDRASAAVPGVMRLAEAFAPAVVGEGAYTAAGVPPADPQGNPNGAGYLASFRLSAERLKAANYRACGHMTVEGCETLKPEHLPVFDCANVCGKDGKRCLSVGAHLEMMAAVQPALSGAISKTVNFPAGATPGHFRAAAVRSWKLGLKAMAGYRDGSKMSQPLNTGSDGDADGPDDGDEPDLTDTPVAAPAPASAAAPRKRRKLPNRVRTGDRVKLSIMGPGGKAKFYLRCGDYPEGGLGEIFIDCAKEGATLRGIMGAFAKAISIGLQWGVPLDEFVEAFIFTKFEPFGPIQGHDRLRQCTSILDAIFRELAITYLKRDDLAHVQPAAVAPAAPDDYPATAARAVSGIVQGFGLKPELVGDGSPANYANAVQASRARESGYTGNQCPKCKLFCLVRAGACEKCVSCGEQSGCM
jgi:ribonucleoside-diphosphate reductase alpha chain